MTVTAAAVAVSSLFATLQTSKDFGYHPSRPVGSIVVTIDAPAATPQQIAAVTAVVAERWPAARSAPFSKPAAGNADRSIDPVVPKQNQCPWPLMTNGSFATSIGSEAPERLPDATELAAARSDWRCAGADYSDVTDRAAGTHSTSSYGSKVGVVIGGPEMRRMVTGIEDAAADAVLRQGGTVLLDRRFAGPGGAFGIQVSHDDEATVSLVIDRTTWVPAALGRWSETSATAVVSEAAAHKAGLAQVTNGVIIDAASPPTYAELDALSSDLAAAGLPVYADLETGSAPFREQPSPWLILGLAAALIALTIAVVTALSVADARDDLATLGAVGAPGWMRRRFSGWSALVVAGVGCLLGGLLGLVPAFGLTRLLYQTGVFAKPFFEVPWVPVLTLIAALPLLAFLVAATVTRSKISATARTS